MKKMTKAEKQARIIPARAATREERMEAVRQGTSQVKTKVRVGLTERCSTCGQWC